MTDALGMPMVTPTILCKHCGQPISDDPYPVHLRGLYRGKSRCDPEDSGLPYGYNADPEGATCSSLCLGAHRD